MSPEETFRRVLAARLPAGPGWMAWIDGTVSELAAAGVTLTPEEAALARKALQGEAEVWDGNGQHEEADKRWTLATRLEAS